MDTAPDTENTLLEQKCSTCLLLKSSLSPRMIAFLVFKGQEYVSQEKARVE